MVLRARAPGIPGQKGTGAAMAHVGLGNQAKLSWLLLRGGMRQLAGRANSHPLLRLPLCHYIRS